MHRDRILDVARKPWRLVFVAAAAAATAASGFGCGGPKGGGDVAVVGRALSNGDVTGFEVASSWSTTAAGAVLATAPAHTQGTASLAVRPSNSNPYVALASASIGTLAEVSNTLALDIMLPTQQPNPAWLGAVQLYVTCPSRALQNVYLGQVELTGKPVGAWTTLSFSLSNAVVTSLLSGGYTDLSFGVALNVPVPVGGPYLIDNLRFIPATACIGKPNGSSCTDGSACTVSDRCQNNVCRPGTAITCAAPDQCHVAGTCNPATGVCSNPAKTDGAACNDRNACTQADSCQAGACTGGVPVACAAQDQCHVAGVCDPTTGACSNPAVPDGTACNDGDACTQADSCQAGVCAGAEPVTCVAQDQCHAAGVCDPATGACSNPAVPDGTACNDGDACTQADSCQAGVCAGAEPVTCVAQDQCHAAGVCDPATGACSNPAVADGTACNDGNACTRADSCQLGVCAGAEPVACAASDACHVAGTCDPGTGACSNPVAADDTPCDDGNACTTGDRCRAGACAKSDPVVCAASDGCHPGACDPSTGACANPLSCHLYGVGSIPGTATDGLVVSPLTLEDGTPNNRVGGIGSDIAYTGVGDLFVSAPDRGPGDGSSSYTDRFYLIELSLAGGQVTPSLRGAATLDQGAGLPTFTGISSAFDATNSSNERRLDVEGLRVGRAGTLFASDEYGPFIDEFSAEGHRLRTLAVPDKFLIDHPGTGDDELPPTNTKGRQANRGMEGLAISPDGSKLYGIMQSPLIQDGALSSKNDRVGTNVRILEVDVDTGATRELLYPMASPSYGNNEILAVNDHQLLVLERDGKGGTSAAFKRLFLIDTAGATDISGVASLPTTGVPAGVTPVAKTLFLDLLDPAFGLAGASFPEKIEGLAFGPDLPDGRHTLVVTSDNDFVATADSKLYVFAIDAAALPGYVAQTASFSSVCAVPAPVTCPATGACSLPGICNPGNGTCSAPVVAAGTLVGAQIAGDCRSQQCDGAGNLVDAIDNTDLPVDGNACTDDLCTGGVPSNPALAAGTSCHQGAGNVCDGAGACVDCAPLGLCPQAPPTVRVVRVGTGTGALSSAATAVFVEERALDGTLLGTIALPTAAAGNNLPFALSGSASSEGGMTLSADGHSLALAGYAAAPGTAGVASTTAAAVSRSAAVIDAAGNVDTSTTFGASAFSGNNVRGAVSADGSGVWAGGAGSANGGLWFAPLGGRTGVQVVSSPNNFRWPEIAGGQLYASGSNGSFVNVSRVGTGLPTVGAQSIAPLPGMPTSGSASPFAFVLLDRDGVPGPETLYVADDRNAPTGGVQKWTLNGATWTLATTFNVTSTPIGFRGLAGFVTGSTVTLVASSADNNNNRLVVFVDDGSATVTGTVIATAASNTAFRGVALSPR
jgi:hypothetical protein